MSETAPNDDSRRLANRRALRAVRELLRPYWLRTVLAVVALVFTSAVMLSIGQGIRVLVDSGFASGADEALNRAVGMFVLMALLLAVGTFARFYLVSWIGERVTADLRRKVFDHVVRLHPGFFESTSSAEIQSRITTDTSLLQSLIGSSISIAMRNSLMFVGGLIWLFITNVKLTSVVLVSVPLVIVPIVVFGRRVRALSKSSQDRIADVGTYVGETLGQIKTVHAFNHQQVDSEAFARHAESAFAVALKRIMQRAWLTGIAILMVLGAIAVMLWIGGKDVQSGVISGGELAAFVFYAVIVAGSVGALSEVLGEVQRAAGAMDRLLELLHTPIEIESPQIPVPVPCQAQASIEVDKAVFHYPTRPETAAIDELSLSVPAGATVALVGVSGAGKSTLFDLLLRFYDLDSGSIRFDGIDIRDLDLQQLRQQIALVPQMPALFSGSIRDNIAYGLPEADMDAVIAAAQAAYAHEFIERLPDGYDSDIGEAGVRLSGGQRQRIAIARAILKDPPMLLLDEATSALDADSEHMLQRALAKLTKDRTTLVIAHRLATVVDADTIVVMDRGKVVATGTHRELLSSSALYSRWADLQFDHAVSTEGDSDAVANSQVLSGGEA